MSPARVFLVDDTATVRHILVEIMEEAADIRVVGTAGDGAQALRRLQNLEVDVLILDVEMPGMSGLEVLREVRAKWPKLPVIIFSSLTERGAMVTIEALSLGATDYVTKPSMTGSPEQARAYIRAELVGRIHALTAPRKLVQPPEENAGDEASPNDARVDAVVIGVSMGGPQALNSLFGRLPGNLPVPVFVVQHMPALFISALAKRLSGQGELKVHEIEGAERVAPGHAWLASGGFHMELKRERTGITVCRSLAEPVNFCRPSVDVLFRSACGAYGKHLLAVVMTGMGQDGLEGAGVIRQAGGQVVTQDRESSVVWGMAGAVVQAGYADNVVSLGDMPGEIVSRVARHRHWSGSPRAAASH